MEEDGLSNEQVEKVLQLQDLTGIEDINVCRDMLVRHQWDIEVAFQEQMNIHEGKPSMFAGGEDVRAPAVVNDRFLQQVFNAHMPGGRMIKNSPSAGNGAENSENRLSASRSFTGLITYFINLVFQYSYSTLTSLLNIIFRRSERKSKQKTCNSVNSAPNLLPLVVTDPLGDVMSFIRNFTERYPRRPIFYQGTYAQALNDAKQELRFLLVYLHKDSFQNPDVNSFCEHTLTDPSVIEFISRNALLWGCDVNSPEGYHVANSLEARSYPFMALIGLRTNRMFVMGRFEGDCTAESLIQRIQTVISSNDVWLSQARADRLERNLTQTLRKQQDEAYRQSLIADEEKERRRELERAKEREAEEALQKELDKAQRRKEEIARLKMELLEKIPPEPAADTPNVISVVFKLSNGERIERRFLHSDALTDISNYLFCHPSTPDEFEIISNFPKRVIYTNSYDHAGSENVGASGSDQRYKTLIDVGLKNREVLFVNDLDA